MKKIYWCGAAAILFSMTAAGPMWLGSTTIGNAQVSDEGEKLIKTV